jgi:uncharacterized phosphosugar-binding protein
MKRERERAKNIYVKITREFMNEYDIQQKSIFTTHSHTHKAAAAAVYKNISMNKKEITAFTIYHSEHISLFSLFRLLLLLFMRMTSVCIHHHDQQCQALLIENANISREKNVKHLFMTSECMQKQSASSGEKGKRVSLSSSLVDEKGVRTLLFQMPHRAQ